MLVEYGTGLASNPSEISRVGWCEPLTLREISSVNWKNIVNILPDQSNIDQMFAETKDVLSPCTLIFLVVLSVS